MIHLLVLSQVALFTAAYLLWDRLRAARAALPADGLRDALAAHLDADLADGYAAMPVRDRELHDPYRTVQELIRYLPGPHVRKRIKALYQLQGTLGLPDAVLDDALGELARTAFMARPVGRVETVRAGALVDRATMRPLNAGTTVRQPLGVIIRDGDGRVLSRADVVCY